VAKYVEKTFSVRVKKKDGTLKLLQGVHGIPMVGAIIKVPVGNGQLLIARITVESRSTGKPAQAEEI
jgi:hypothetical protein